MPPDAVNFDRVLKFYCLMYSHKLSEKMLSFPQAHGVKFVSLTMLFLQDMEDEHVHKLCLNDEKDTHYFAVFDGHGGQGAAQYAAKQLDMAIINHNAFRKHTNNVA